MKRGTQVIYVDESGTPDVFNRDGRNLVAAGVTSNHLVIAAVRCEDPSGVGSTVGECVAWADGQRRLPLGYLHASEDTTAMRRRACEKLSALPIKALAVVMDKRRLSPAKEWMHDRSRFYRDLAGILLSRSLHVYEETRLVFSIKDFATDKDLETLVRGVSEHWELYMRSSGLPVPTSVLATHDRMKNRPGLQVADYVAWAIHRAFERGDLTYYELLRPIIRYVYDVTDLTHYSRKRPIENPPRLASPAD